MFKIHLPWVGCRELSLRDLFAERGIRFGMACEASSFDSSVQAPLILKHCHVVVPEVSGKMMYTQPQRGVWDFSMMDALVAKAEANEMKVFGHTTMWHMQNPDWLEPTLANVTRDEGMYILREHVMTWVHHFKDKLIGMDVINELGAVMSGTGWAKYLGMECANEAIIAAENACGWAIPLYYNSFFNDDADADFAINMLDMVDGIGVQLHLEAAFDYSAKFNRVRRILEACRQQKKSARFSEVTVYDPTNNMRRVAEVYADTIRLMKEYLDVVTDYVTWGVKYPAWNGRHVLFDKDGKQTEAFRAVANELVIT